MYPWFVNKNTVNKFMDVFVGQFGNGGVLQSLFAYQCNKPFHVRAALGGVVDFL